MEPAALRTFFEHKVCLGSQRGLTFFAFLVAKLWEFVFVKWFLRVLKFQLLH